MDSLLEELRALEVELHHPGVRCDAKRLGELLHPHFHEVGRSGARYDRETVIRYLGERGEPPQVVSDDFAVTALAKDVACLTYRSAQRRAEGGLELHTYRSSVWSRTIGAWLLLYQQGSPTQAFA